MARMDLWKCDWCGDKKEVESGETPAPPWPERDGGIPILKRDAEKNEKYFIVVRRRLQFCTDKCNQAHKETEAVCEGEAQKAWLAAYNQRRA